MDKVLTDIQKRSERYFIDGDSIVLTIRKDVTYDIPLTKCNTYTKIIAWQIQLAPKRWVTKDVIIQFTLLACDYHKLRIAHL